MDRDRGILITRAITTGSTVAGSGRPRALHIESWAGRFRPERLQSFTPTRPRV